MSQDRRDIFGLEGFRVSVGLSSVIGVTIVPGQIATVVKYFTGGTLELVNGLTPSPWGMGYVFGSTEALAIDQSTTAYFAATGATVTVMMVRGRSAGYEGV